ncbi:MAG: O-antigen ligase family protein [Prevotella sp.]
MIDKTYSNSISAYTHENGGRVAILLLLFFVAIYQFINAGFNAFAIVCMLPVGVLALIIAFKYKMFTFWAMFVVNYFVMFLSRSGMLPVPTSVPTEMLEVLLLAIAVINMKWLHFDRIANVMFLSLIVWCLYCTLEVLNNTCGLGIDPGAWFMGARLMAFQLMYAFLVCSIYIHDAKRIHHFFFAWAALSLFAAFWAWKQKYIGFTEMEKQWLVVAGRTHFVNGIIRYFSVFSDAANFGCHMAAASVTFYIIAITTKIRRHRIFFLVSGILSTWAMFSSGTRTALFCLILGVCAYIVLSKSFKIAIPVTIVSCLCICFLAFTTFGNGNDMIRRMRSGFNRNDASASVRDLNKASIKKYIQDAPWGIGIGNGYENVPASNKYRKLSTIPPDSEYVFIWVHTGIIGLIVFLITTIVMWLGACWVVFFRIKNKSLQGMGAGICCAFIAIQLGGYGNQILMQYPNVLIFYGGLSLVFIMPHLEAEYNIYEAKLLAEQEERNRIKLEKKRALRI